MIHFKKCMSKIIAGIVSLVCLTAFSFSVNATSIPDPNGDGQINLADATLVSRYLDGQIATSSQTANYDINQNGIVSQLDLKLIMLYIVGAWNGG